MTLPTQIDLQIVTPDKLVVRERVDEVEVPGANGYFGVLPGHAPLLAALAVGELWYRKGSERFYVAIAYGFAEVLPDTVTILAQLAERAEDVDVARAEAAKKQAEDRLGLPSTQSDEVERARIALTKAQIRLQVASRIGSSRAGELKQVRT
jgi:F-type H+-transporting ATPase subunit epsilon